MRNWNFLIAIACVVVPMLSAAAAEPSGEEIEFFEKQIRPLFVQHCQECHGTKKQKAGLRLDSSVAFAKGSDEGPVATAGEPDKSKLIRAVRHVGELKMPKDKLPDAEIEKLTQWVKIGMPWPADVKSTAGLSGEEKAKTHWAFQPIGTSNPPEVKNVGWATTPLDRFVLAKLEEKNLTPAPAADRRTWLRRVSFDLVGLPPTPEQVLEFVNDPSAEAYAKVVDRLLAAPQFGERWGRYWLDVARYADTKGYVFQEERKYPFAYVYRDWVVKAFNEDLPYDQFLLRQLAADQFPNDGDKREWAALGFLTLGRRFLNNKADILDDRIDVISRGLMGLTVACARCHDHKFDPISMKDYYGLYGVLSPAQEKQIPISTPSPEYTAGLQAREKTINDFLQVKREELLNRLRASVEKYLLAAASPDKGKDGDNILTENDVRSLVVVRWRKLLEDVKKKNTHPLSPWVRFAELKAEQFAEKAAEISAEIAADEKLNAQARGLFSEKPPESLKDLTQRYGRLFADVEMEWQNAIKSASEKSEPKPERLADANREAVRQILYANDAPANVPSGDLEKLFDKPTKDKVRDLRRKVGDWQAGAQALLQAFVLEDGPTQGKPRIFNRGNQNNPGAEVERQFFAVVAGPDRKPFKKGSGRLEFAQAVIAKDNPLTARVWVNRMWAHLFGVGMVTTPSDFGVRTDPPSHPELLDYLAQQLVANRYSTKQLLRAIVLSQTYQQATTRANDAAATAAIAIDPENRLLWKMNRRRLDLEGLRDGLLFASGKLDQRVGGPAEDIAADRYSPRRTIYGQIDRQNLPGLFRTFDFAGPDAHSPQRFITTVPQQALFLMNSPFAIEQAKLLAARGDVKDIADIGERVQRMYGIVLGRSATAAELELARQFLEVAPSAGDKSEKLNPWERYAQILLLSNEFAFLD